MRVTYRQRGPSPRRPLPDRPAPRPSLVLAALALALCLLAATAPLARAASTGTEPPRVLILNSYHQGEDWTDNELAGILPALRAVHPDLVPAVEHLDAKRFPGPAHLDRLRRFLGEKYRDRQPDLLMLLDNPALDLLLRHRAEIFPGVPVVFAGINGFEPAMLKGQENVTGVTEEQDMAGTLRLALRLKPGTRKILAIHDHTSSGLAVRHDMEQALAELRPELVGRVEVAFTPKGPFAELERTLRGLPPDAVAVILSYVTDGAGRTFTRAESTRLISQASPVPVLCMHETRLGYGTLGGSLLSGQEHGRRAAEMALAVLAGQEAGSIPVDDKGGSRPMFDHAVLARFGIAEGDLPPGSLVVGRPIGFYEQNRTLVNLALVVATLMVLFIALLATALARGRRAEAALRLSEIRFRTLVENVPGAVYRCALEPPWPVQHMSEGIVDICGRLAAEFMSGRVAYAELIHPEDLGAVERAVESAVAGRKVFDIRYRLVHADGGVRWAHERGRAIYDQAGQPLHLDGTILDITERKRAEEALRLSERRYRNLINSVGDVVFSHDRQGTFLDVNPAITAILGYEPREIIGRRPCDFMKPEMAQLFDSQYLRPLLERGQASGVSAYIHKQGGRRYLEYRSQVVEPGQGEPFFSVVARDVTERVLQERRLRQLEEQLRQSQKMEAVGTLAGGIAHDFNNILGAVLGFAELALDSAETGEGNADELRQIIVAAERARTLVRRILTFSRKLETQTRTVDLNQEVVRALEMLSRTIPKMIALQRSLAPGLWPVQADPAQMEQVLINLGANAVDAMPEGGRLTFATANLTLDAQGSASHHQVPPGDYVLLSVADSGQGMDRRTLEHIFDPFFTTKEVGKGTGLGLAMVYGIVNGHGGHLFCDSLPGRGSTFSIYLPARPAAQAEAPAYAPGPAPAPAGEGRTILLVDDEGMLRSLGERILGAAGYRVWVAGSGEEALVVLDDPRFQVALVVLDLGMPGMGGLKCLERILARDPGAKVVIASGYAADGPVRQALQAGAAGFVAKPYGRADLLATVGAVLDSRRPA